MLCDQKLMLTRQPVAHRSIRKGCTIRFQMSVAFYHIMLKRLMGIIAWGARVKMVAGVFDVERSPELINLLGLF